MADSTVVKVDSEYSPRGPMGQKYLASGKRVSMRLWEEGPLMDGPVTRRSYETVGYVIEGRALLFLNGQPLQLEAGDSWVVPAEVEHYYRIDDFFVAVEATSPPAEIAGRDRESLNG